MKKQVFALMMTVIFGALNAYSQAGMKPDGSTLSAMEKLSKLAGNWTGEGWIQMGRDKQQFSQKETVVQKVNNTVLLIDGKGTDSETDQVIHQAFAVISFDAANDQYLMRAIRADGKNIDAEAKVDENGNFIWGFTIEQVGEVRYTVKLEDDKWVETGEMNRDGTQWFPFLGMTLTKD
jgi:hypothetical protein